jgi:hypothetical protein
MLSSRFSLSTPFVKLVERGINHEDEDMLYNYIDMTSMTKSQIGWAFKVVKEFHAITLQALMDVCSPPDSIVVDLNYKMGNFFVPLLYS